MNRRPDDLGKSNVASPKVYAEACRTRRSRASGSTNRCTGSVAAPRGFLGFSRSTADVLAVGRDRSSFSSQWATSRSRTEPDALAARQSLIETGSARDTALRKL